MLNIATTMGGVNIYLREDDERRQFAELVLNSGSAGNYRMELAWYDTDTIKPGEHLRASSRISNISKSESFFEQMHHFGVDLTARLGNRECIVRCEDCAIQIKDAETGVIVASVRFPTVGEAVAYVFVDESMKTLLQPVKTTSFEWEAIAAQLQNHGISLTAVPYEAAPALSL